MKRNAIQSRIGSGLLAGAALMAGCVGLEAAAFTTGGPYTYPANGHIYYLISPATWNDAEAYAQTLGGHLVTINNAAENDWVFQTIVSSDPNRNPWTGLHASTLSGPWTWSSGEPLAYLNWDPNEPNGIGAPPYGVNMFEAAAASRGITPGTWNDAPMSDVVPGIVELVPEPTAASLLAISSLGLVSAQWRRSRRDPREGGIAR